MNVKDIFREHGFHNGRMISGSKSGYSSRNKGNVIVFNSRICTISEGIIWWGDLDITKDEEELKNVAERIGETLYILRESDAWDQESVNEKLILERNVTKIG
jgi:hypothetical protein